MLSEPVLQLIAAILILFVLVVTWISTHPPKPPRRGHPSGGIEPTASSPSQPSSVPPVLSQPSLAAPSFAPSPIPHGHRLVLVILMIIATVATIIRYALTH